jgi:hypothetical protein
MKLLVEIEVSKDYGKLDKEALEGIRDRIDDDWPNYITVTNSEGEEVSIEILEILGVTIEEDEEEE